MNNPIAYWNVGLYDVGDDKASRVMIITKLSVTRYINSGCVVGRRQGIVGEGNRDFQFIVIGNV